MGGSLVRQFNLSEPELWRRFIAPLMAGRDFTYEGHEFIPTRTRITILDGPSLRADQLALGRGWQNAQRLGRDVTEALLATARERARLERAGRERAEPGGAAAAPGLAEILRERLIGRLSAGSVAAGEIAALAAELMPSGGEGERRLAAQRAAWMVMERGFAELSPCEPQAQQAPPEGPSGR